MAQTYDVFLPEILPYCQGISELLVERETRNCVIQLCREARVFRRDLDPMTVTSNVYEYDLDIPLGTEVVEIESLTYKGDLLVPKTLKEVEGRTTTWRQQNGTPLYYVRRERACFWLVPVPSSTEANAISGEVSLAPSRTSTSFDDEVYEQYFEPIKSLVLSKLLRIPNKDWTSVSTANQHLAIYRQAVTDAEVRARKAQRGAAPVVRYSGAGAGSTLKDDYGTRRTR